MLVEMEFAGVRIPGMEENHCLAQSHFPHLRVSPDPWESFAETGVLAVRAASLEVVETELVDAQVGLYRMRFRVQAGPAERAESGEMAFIEDEIRFVVYASTRLVERKGCGGIIQGPEHFLIDPDCTGPATDADADVDVDVWGCAVS